MASKDSNGLVISLSVFVLLTVAFAVLWYMTWADASKLRSDLDVATKAKTDAETTTRTQLDDANALKTFIGRPEPEADDVVTKGKERLVAVAGNGTVVPDTMNAAVEELATARNAANASARDRDNQLQVKVAELAAAVASHANALKSLQDALKTKEDELLEKERVHGEQLSQREKQIDDLKNQLMTVQSEFSTFREEKERQIESLTSDIERQRQTLKRLRAAKFNLENINFERPAGQLVSVDQNTLTATIDLGTRDNLRIGTSFSVYMPANSGVGLSQSDKDIKGKIVVTEILGPSQAKVEIVNQKLGMPMGSGDPIYSPIFSPGQALEIAVVGKLDFDGNPGSDREEFHRILRSNGALLALEVNDEAQILAGDGVELAEADIEKRITSSTRFVLIADLGDENTEDTVQRELNSKIRRVKDRMEQVATDNGVYLLSLSRFLDYIGYSRKSLVWSPTRKFPATLPNGGLSDLVHPTFGEKSGATIRPDSLGSVSGVYMKRKAKQPVSMGSTSSLYEGTDRVE